MVRVIAICLTLFSLSAWGEASEKAGLVILSLGKNYAHQPDSDSRLLKRKSDIFDKDVVVTGKKGRIQLRFTDGSLLALGSDSQFEVEKYHYSDEKPAEGKSVYKLLKGSMRTITGAISKADTANYEVKTPIATIGVRGTDYTLAFCEEQCQETASDSGLYGYVLEGGIRIRTAEKREEVMAGRYFFVNQSGQIQISEQPLIAFELLQGLISQPPELRHTDPSIPALEVQNNSEIEQLISPNRNGTQDSVQGPP